MARLLLKSPLERLGLDEVLTALPLAAAAAGASARHGLPWPPASLGATAGSSRGAAGAVARVRGHVAAGGVEAEGGDYAGDFEALSGAGAASVRDGLAALELHEGLVRDGLAAL